MPGRVPLLACAVTILLLSGCIGASVAVPESEWTPPELVEPAIVEQVRLEVVAGAPEICYVLLSGAWHPAQMQHEGAPNMAHLDIDPQWAGLPYTITFGATGQEIAEYGFMLEYADDPWYYTVGSGSPGGTRTGELPPGINGIWIWHCIGGAGEAVFTVYDGKAP